MAAAKTLPYVTAYGNITKVLDKIKSASTPPRFTTDFLGTTLDMSGGSARPVIPFLKRTGFLASDGTPTELYKRFRNSSKRGAAAAEALRIGYKPLYDINEFVHNAKDSELRGVIVQATGAEDDSKTVQVTVGSFKALKAFADFSAGETEDDAASDNGDAPAGEAAGTGEGGAGTLPAGLNLRYSINLHLPATSDVAVFNAIFKSLREHLVD